MKRKFAILLSVMLLMQAVCGCGGAASSGTSSASASTGSTASKSNEIDICRVFGLINATS